MPNYVLTFRSQSGRTAAPEEEAAWGQWFQQLGGTVTDFGHRVGHARALGNASGETVLSGYVVIAADNLVSAVEVAKGCPGLSQGGGVEIGETVDNA
ncbi:MAG: hypothetical protein ACRDZQ_02350 [Acidimicrobiales bacterium]